MEHLVGSTNKSSVWKGTPGMFIRHMYIHIHLFIHITSEKSRIIKAIFNFSVNFMTQVFSYFSSDYVGAFQLYKVTFKNAYFKWKYTI